MTIRTTSTMRTVGIQPTGGAVPYMAATFAPEDPLFDAMGYSRGRIVVGMSAEPLLVVPAWPEILRVAEDCRG